jgi:hypothetical protein
VDYRFPKTAGNSERTAKDLAVFSPAEPTKIQGFCGERDATR